MLSKWQMSILNWLSVAYLLQRIANIIKLWCVCWDNTAFWPCAVRLAWAAFIHFLQNEDGSIPESAGM